MSADNLMSDAVMVPREPETVAGEQYARLGNAVSDAINAALVGGMEMDEACSISVGVVGDYWRTAYPLGESEIAGFVAVLTRVRP